MRLFRTIRTMVRLNGSSMCLLICAVIAMLLFANSDCTRNKRSLIYPKGTAKVQAIMGAGFPVDLRDETVILGIVIKSIHLLPQNASFYTNPNVVLAKRRKRTINDSRGGISRWEVYKIIEQYAQFYGYGAKGCILRTICELAERPIDENGGILEEILHVLFTPSITDEKVHSNSDNEYYAAQKIGSEGVKGKCRKFFPDCVDGFVDVFTTLA